MRFPSLRGASRIGLWILVAILSLGLEGCSSGRNYHHGHASLHEYRHGYYNPVDGYFHDDHWVMGDRYSQHYYGEHPHKNPCFGRRCRN